MNYLKHVAKCVITLNGKFPHKTTPYTLNNCLLVLHILLTTFIQHNGDGSVVTHEDGARFSSSCVASPKSKAKIAERLPQKIGITGSQGHHMGYNGVKLQTLVTHINKIKNHQ